MRRRFRSGASTIALVPASVPPFRRSARGRSPSSWRRWDHRGCRTSLRSRRALTAAFNRHRSRCNRAATINRRRRPSGAALFRAWSPKPWTKRSRRSAKRPRRSSRCRSGASSTAQTRTRRSRLRNRTPQCRSSRRVSPMRRRRWRPPSYQFVWQLQIGCLAWCSDTTQEQSASQSNGVVVMTLPQASDPPPTTSPGDPGPASGPGDPGPAAGPTDPGPAPSGPGSGPASPPVVAVKPSPAVAVAGPTAPTVTAPSSSPAGQWVVATGIGEHQPASGGPTSSAPTAHQGRHNDRASRTRRGPADRGAPCSADRGEDLLGLVARRRFPGGAGDALVPSASAGAWRKQRDRNRPRSCRSTRTRTAAVHGRPSANPLICNANPDSVVLNRHKFANPGAVGWLGKVGTQRYGASGKVCFAASQNQRDLRHKHHARDARAARGCGRRDAGTCAFP